MCLTDAARPGFRAGCSCNLLTHSSPLVPPPPPPGSPIVAGEDEVGVLQLPHSFQLVHWQQGERGGRADVWAGGRVEANALTGGRGQRKADV